MATQNLQVKLALDPGLQKIWSFLTEEYMGVDKAGIIRLALNNLVKVTKREKAAAEKFDMEAFFADLDKGKSGMTEKEFAVWWNKNKHDILK